MSRANDEYDRLEFDRAGRTLQRALEHGRNCRMDLAEIYRLRAHVDAIHGRREACRRGFASLLAIEPGFAMAPGTAPKIRSCFEEARDLPELTLRLMHQPPMKAVEPDVPLSLEVALHDPLRLSHDVQVHFRRSGVPVYTTVRARADDRVSVEIPALSLPSTSEAYTVEYFVRAVNRWNGVLAEAGSTEAPLELSVVKGRGKRAFYKTWWFWTLTGAAVAGGVTSVVLLTSESDAFTVRAVDATPTGSP